MRLVLLILLVSVPSIALAAVVLPYVGMWLVSEGGWYAVAGWVLTIGSAVYGAAQARKQADQQREQQRRAYNDALKDRTITQITSSAPYRYILGDARVGSDIVAMFTSGDKDQYRWMVCVHAAHEVDSVIEYYIAGKALGALDANGWVTGGDYYRTKQTSTSEQFTGTTITLAHTPVAATVRVIYYTPATGQSDWEPVRHSQQFTLSGSTITLPANVANRTYTVNYDWAEPVPRVRVISHLGGATDPVDAVLNAAFPAKWTATAVLRGFFYSVVMLDLNQQEFQGGLVSVEVRARGMKLHDPRDGAYPNDTPVWSQNPALVALWYLRSELCEIAQAEIPLADYITAANVCAPDTGYTYSQSGYTVTVNKTAHGRIVNEVVEMKFLTGTAISGYFTILTVPNANQFTYTAYIWNGTGYTADSRTTSGNATIGGRYTFNGSITADQGPSNVLELIAQSMAGGIVKTTWSCWAGVYTAPVLALTQDDIVGKFETLSGTPASQLYNGVRGRYISPDNAWVDTDYTPYQNAAYVAADGKESWAQIDYPFTDAVSRVHNLNRIYLEDQRAGFTIKGIFSLKVYKLRIGERVTFTSDFYGESAKVFRLTDRTFGLEQGLELTLKEDAAATYDKADATSPEVTPNSNYPSPWTIAAPVGMVIQQNQLNPERAEVYWSQVLNVYAYQYQVEYFGTKQPTWIPLAPVSGTSLNIDGLLPDTYNFRVKTINPILNIHSDYSAIFTWEMRVMEVPIVSGLEIFGRGFVTIFGGKHCRLAWRKASLMQYFDIGSEAYGGNSGGRDYFFKDYMVKVYSAANVLLRTEYVTDENYIYTYEHNAEDHGGTAAREFSFKVWQRGKYGQLSAVPSSLTVSNPVPALPAVTVLEGTDTVTFTYAEPDDLDWAGIKIWMDTASGFTPGAANLVYDGVDTAATVNGIVPNTAYYFRYAVKDQFGDSATSAEASFITQLTNQALVSADAVASISLSPHGANRDDGAGGNTGGGVLLSSVLFDLPKTPAAIKLSAAAMGVITRTSSPYNTFTHYAIAAKAIKNLRKLTGTISINSAGVITGTGTAFLTELFTNSRLLFGSANGSSSFCTVLGADGIVPVPVNAPTTNSACTLITAGLSVRYADSAFTYSGEAWAYDEVFGSLYSAGTVTMVSGSTIVNGVGTSWLTNIQPGADFRRIAYIGYTVQSVVSDTQLILSTPYAEGSESGVSYFIDYYLSFPFNEVVSGATSGSFEARPHAAFVREFTLAEMTALISGGANNLLIMSSASESTSGQPPSVSVYSCERNVIIASVEML